MIGGSDSPCSTNVTRMTVKLIRMISDRKGKGAPEPVVSGSAKAAAKVTMPRMPVQEMRNSPFHGGMGSRARKEALSHRGIRAARGTQRNRTTIAVALTMRPANRTEPYCPAGTASRRAPSCRPIKIKITPLRIKITSSHTARACRRVAGATAPLKYWRIVIPPATQANTADAWTDSAMTQAIYGTSSVTPICVYPSSVAQSAQRVSQAAPMPIASAASAANTKLRTVPPNRNEPLTTAPTAARYNTRAVASLTRLSPSRMVTTRRGIRRRFPTAVADTASGGETMAPRAMASAQPMPGNRTCATAATPPVVASTSPTARREIGLRFCRNSRNEVK